MSIPKIAAGSAFPKYSMNFGVDFFDENTKKGRKRVIIVPSEQRDMVIICSVNVIRNFPIFL